MILTKVTTPVIGWVAEVLGFIMRLLFDFTNKFGVQNIGLCIILFTVIVDVLLIPMTIKQQKSAKLMSVMQPEINAIQKKYQGKTDAKSQQRMQIETQAVYEKYGTNMFGGCGPLVIQLPILIALYQVIYHIPGYVPAVKEVLEPMARAIMSNSNFVTGITDIAKAVKLAVDKVDYADINNVIDFLYKLSPSQWKEIAAMFPAHAADINAAAARIGEMNTFLGVNLSAAPWQGFKPNLSWIIPFVAAAAQWLSAKVMMKNQPKQEGTAGQSMQMMNNLMPLMSLFFCFTLPAGIGVYWVASAVVRTIIQVIINKKFENIDIDKLVEENLEKTNRKRAKKGLPPKTVDKKAILEAEREERARDAEEAEKAVRKEKSDKQVIDSTQYYNLNAAENSLTAKANMVAKFNDRQLDSSRRKNVVMPKEEKDGNNSNG